MKRKMVYIGLPVLLGLLFASFLNTEFDLLVVIAAVLMFFFLKYPVKMKYIEATVCIIAFAFGFFMYRINDSCVNNKIAEYRGQKVEFSGMITDYTDYSGDMASYTLKGKINGVTPASIVYYGAQQECRYGDRFQLTCVLECFENSYSFDTVNYYKSKGIFFRTSSVEKSEFISTDGFAVIRAVYTYREYIHQRIMSVMHYDEGNMLSSMLFGSSYADMENDIKTAMYRLGTGHIFAVSGYHLMLAALIFSVFLKKISAGKVIVFFGVSLSALMFIVSSGFSVSAIRAGIIIVISYSAVIFSRMDDALNSLSIAVIFMSVFNPFIVKSPSFMLSVAGFYGIAVFAPYMTKNMSDDTFLRRLAKSFVSALCVMAVIIPVSALFFAETSVLSAVTSIIMLPVVSFVILLGMIVFITGGVEFIAYPLLKAADLLCEIVKNAALSSADVKFATIALGYEFMRYILIAVFIFVCITFAVYKNEKTVGISVLLSVIIVISGNIYHNSDSSDILTIAVFGKESAEMVMVDYGNCIDIIDISGERKNPVYAVNYMQKYGKYDVNDIILCKKPYRFTLYDDNFTWYDVDSFYLPENTFVLDNSLICGCTPKYYGNGCLYIEYNDYTISYRENEVCIEYNDSRILCSDKGLEVISDDESIIEMPVDNYTIIKTDGYKFRAD